MSDFSSSKEYKKLIHKLEELDRLDQKIRNKKYGYPMSDTIRKVDSLNVLKLISLIDEYGYTSENIIGIKNPKKTYQKPQNIVRRHYFQRQTVKKENQNIFSNRINSALENGEICPIQYSVWEDFRYKGLKYGV